MIIINIKNNRLDNFELELGQLFESRSSKEYYLLVSLGTDKCSLVNINGKSFWGETCTFKEMKKRVINDIDLGILTPIKNQKIIIEGEI